MSPSAQIALAVSIRLIVSGARRLARRAGPFTAETQTHELALDAEWPLCHAIKTVSACEHLLKCRRFVTTRQHVWNVAADDSERQAQPGCEGEASMVAVRAPSLGPPPCPHCQAIKAVEEVQQTGSQKRWFICRRCSRNWLWPARRPRGKRR